MRGLQQLQERRAYECRLTPDRALGSLDDAAEFLDDRGLLTWAPDSSLPSLYAALHEDPAEPERRWWLDALAEREDVYMLPIHRGKPLLLSEDAAAIVDPVLRAEIERMSAAPDWGELLRSLAEKGPATFEDARRHFGLKRHEFALLVSPLERCGAVVRRAVVLEGAGGPEAGTTELARWDQVFAAAPRSGGLDDVIVAGVRAAVVTRDRDIGRWFSWSWRLSPSLLERLVAEGRLERPEPGWVSLPN
jgi:hypothetical protein